MAKERAKTRSEAKLPDGRVIIVAAGDEVPDGAELIGEAQIEEPVRTTVSRRAVRSTDVSPPDTGTKPKRQRKSKGA